MAQSIAQRFQIAFLMLIIHHVILWAYYFPMMENGVTGSFFSWHFSYSFVEYPQILYSQTNIIYVIMHYLEGLTQSWQLWLDYRFVPLFIVSYLMISWRYFLRVIINWKYYALPYKLQNLQQDMGNTENNKMFIILTEHLFKKKIDNRLYYKSKIIVKREEYTDYKEQICNYLGCDTISFNYIPKTMNFYITLLTKIKSATFQFSYIKENAICMGIDFNEKLYYFNHITHIVGGGQSGGGKTNLIEIMLLNLFHWYTYGNLEKIYIIDFKRTDLQKYKDFEILDYYGDINEAKILLQSIVKLTAERNALPKDSLEMKNLKPIFLIVDEFTDMMQDKSCIELINEIGRKARSAKIYIIVFLQKIDDKSIPTQLLNNLQSKILLKTDDDNTRNKLIGNEIIFEENNLINPSDFTIGDIIVKDGLTSQYSIIKVFKFEEEYFQTLQKNFKKIDKSLNKLKQEIESAIFRASQNKEDIFSIRHLKPIDKDNYVKYMDSLIQNLKNTLLKLVIEDDNKVKNIIYKIDERVPFFK